MKNNVYKTVLFGIVIGIAHSAYSGNGEPKNNPVKAQESFRFQEGVTVNDYEANTIILKLKPAYREQAQVNAINNTRLVSVFAQLGTQGLKKIYPNHTPPSRATDEAGNALVDLSLIYKFNFTANISIIQAINKIVATGLVEYAEPNYIYRVHGKPTPVEDVKKVLAAFNPNDPSIGQQYFINRIKCPDAWGVNDNTARGDTNVVVGIVDTGTDIDHPDLKSKIKYNYNDPINGIDDDKDGYVDNFRGWDISDNDNNPNVDNSTNEHGSHVSGCAAAATNNGVGVASPGFNCKFIAVKATKKTSTGVVDNGFEAIVYAADHGCSVINNSYGGPGGEQYGQDVMTYASINKKALVIASAGNDSREVTNYPAAYNYVLSIGATTSSDAKSGFSTYALSVDVCAPGSGIYTTVYNNSYKSMDGTSMAGPICAGAAAIVKSFYPSYTGLQVGEQLKATADNIYGVGSNGSYKDKLGAGRINLYRALTETPPSVRMEPIIPIDGNDNSLSVGDTIMLTGKIINYLAPGKNVVGTLSTTNTDVTILNPTINVGPIGTLAPFDVNALNAFKFVIKSSASLNEKVLFKLFFSDGNYSGYQYFTIAVNVDYINININSVASTNTSRGRIGYNTGDVTAGGLGFVYNDSLSMTYEAGLMIGVSSSKVSDNLRGSGTANDADFSSMQIVKKRMPAVKSEFETHGVFSDNGASSKIGVQVNHNTYAWTTPGDKKYIIFEYIIKNTGSATLNNLYAGIFSDWDVTGATSAKNKVATDVANKLGYAYSAVDPKYCAGIRVVSKTPFLHYAIDNLAGGGGGVDVQDKTNKFSTADKYTALSTNRATAGDGSPTGNDVMSVVSTGPFTINSKDSVTVAFALLAGDDVSDITKSSTNAQIKYDNLTVTVPKITGADGFALKQNYPNPVNASKTIIEFNLPEKTRAELTIYNSMGQKVKNVLNTQLDAGTHQLNVDLADFSNGLYFYELKAGNNAAMMKMVVQQ